MIHDPIVLNAISPVGDTKRFYPRTPREMGSGRQNEKINLGAQSALNVVGCCRWTLSVTLDGKLQAVVTSFISRLQVAVAGINDWWSAPPVRRGPLVVEVLVASVPDRVSGEQVVGVERHAPRIGRGVVRGGGASKARAFLDAPVPRWPGGQLVRGVHFWMMASMRLRPSFGRLRAPGAEKAGEAASVRTCRPASR